MQTDIRLNQGKDEFRGYVCSICIRVSQSCRNENLKGQSLTEAYESAFRFCPVFLKANIFPAYCM